MAPRPARRQPPRAKRVGFTIGGHGKVGLRAARLLTSAGDEVTSWVRNPEHRTDVEAAGAGVQVAADEHLRSTTLDWTILGPSRLTDGPGTGMIEIGGAGIAKTSVRRDDVAAVLAHTLGVSTTVGRTIDFNNGETPIAQAISD